MNANRMIVSLLEDVAAVLHPRPEPPADVEWDADAKNAYLTEIQEITALRGVAIAELEAEWERDGTDPLLAALADARRRREEAEADMRALLAYGREVVLPRAYTLADLAAASGMSVSGVRTAYDDADVAYAIEATGGDPAA